MPQRSTDKPVQKRSRQTVEDIVEASVAILEAVGEKNFTTNHIAERAGYSVGSLYRFFPNKDAITAAIARHQEARTLAKLTELLERKGDKTLEGAIRAMVHVGITAFQSRRRVRRFVIIQIVKLNLHKWAFKQMEITASTLVKIVELYGGDRVRSFSEASAFVFSRSLMLTIRSSIMEEKGLIDDPEFEDELVRLALAFVLKPEELIVRSTASSLESSLEKAD